MAQRICSVDDCDKPVVAKGKCRKHYQRVHKPLTAQPCTVTGCTKTARTLGWRPMHYGRWLKTATTDDPPPKAIPECSEDGCTDPATRRGMCEKHYRRVRRAENGDQIRATRATWREANRMHVNTVYADWEKRNPVKVSMRDRANKGRRRAIIGSPDPVNYLLILAEHGMVCHLCTRAIASLDDLHFDHVVPLARGGLHGNH